MRALIHTELTGDSPGSVFTLKGVPYRAGLGDGEGEGRRRREGGVAGVDDREITKALDWPAELGVDGGAILPFLLTGVV